MTKRKRTPPPTPKLIGFQIPASLNSLAIQCRQLREQSELPAPQPRPQIQASPSSDQALDQAVDAQLNAQLNATLSPPAQSSSINNVRNNPSHHRPNKTRTPKQDSEAAHPIANNVEHHLNSMPQLVQEEEQEEQQSYNPQSDEQLDVYTSNNQMAYPSQASQYFDQSSSVAQIRFDPYIAPGQTPYYFATTQQPPGSSVISQSHFTQPTSQEQHSSAMDAQNQYSYNYPTQAQMSAMQANPYAASSYVTIPPNNGQSTVSSSQQYPFPNNQPQPGYYRLPPSYWQTPPPLATTSMTEANQRVAASVAASNAKRNHIPDDFSHYNTSPHNQGMNLMLDGSQGYPDPGPMEMGTGGPSVMTGGVFRNLTKERFGRYSVGGKLVGAGKEIYSG